MEHTLRGNATTREIWLDDEWLDPRPSQLYRNHSPDGFSWGYGGSGPSQLALAVILELTGSPNGYQEFKWEYISKIPTNQNFEITFTDEEIKNL